MTVPSEPAAASDEAASEPPPPDVAPDDIEPEATAAGRLAPDLKIGEVRRGAKPGTRYVRVTRASERPFQRVGATRWRATLAAERPKSAVGRVFARARHIVFGAPMATSRAIDERLSKVKALAVFSSDALSSSAYATEEILLALVLAGSLALTVSLPIALAIGLVFVIVVFSYRQTVRAYPRGGGAYSVAHANLGLLPGLIGAAALLTDYTLTVAVSVSAGVLAIVSAVPDLAPHTVPMAVGAVVVVAGINLRGVRESGTILALPTYLFIFTFASMLIVGLIRLAGGLEGATLTTSAPPRETIAATQALTLFLILRAFSSGAVALSGTEAMATGVPAFQPPEWRNAATTLLWMGVILGSFFIGATFLAARLGVVPMEHQSVIAQLGKIVFGGENLFFYLLQATTAMILLLAANTAFNGFPMLASILARDEFLPRQFAFRGDRLAYSNGILVLATIAITLLVAFQADTHRLIPLYAIGVFTAFTLSQAGMVLHWRRTREPGWRRSAVINGTGAIVTFAVAMVVAITKFMLGAWIVLILVPAIVAVLYVIHRHYASARTQLHLEDGGPALSLALPPDRPVIVPVSEVNLATARALIYAKALSSNVTALHVVTEEGEDTTELEEYWHSRYPETQLIVLDSPYRSFQAPFMAYIDALSIPEGVPLTVVLPEFVPTHWWQRFLHNRTANRLRDALYHRPNTVVISVTQQLA